MSTHNTQSTEYFILESGMHTHFRNSQPYQLTSTHALTGQAFFNK